MSSGDFSRGPSADIKFPSLSEAAEATAMPYLPILVKGLLPDNCYSDERTREGERAHFLKLFGDKD